MKKGLSVWLVALFLQVGCGSTTGGGDSALSSPGSGTTEPAAGSGGAGKSSEGITIGGNVLAPANGEAAISVGSSAFKSAATVSKAAATELPAKKGDVSCKRYDGTFVAKGIVNHQGEIADAVVPPALLDETGQIFCEAALSDGRKFLNHYDLAGKKTGESVVQDCDVSTTLAAQQVLFHCSSSTTFEDVSACAAQIKRGAVDSRLLFQKYKEMSKTDEAERKLVQALKAGMAGPRPPTPAEINRILEGNGADLLENFKKLDASLKDWEPDAAVSSIKSSMNGGFVKKPAEKMASFEVLEAGGKGKSRWAFNPLDNRGQGNNGKPEMLDPYGQSKDDRMAVYGNRGRVIGKGKPTNAYIYTRYVYVDGFTHWLWLNNTTWGVYPVPIYGRAAFDLATLGYTAEEAAFILGLDSYTFWTGFLQSFAAMPPVQTTLAPIADLNLGRVLNYVDSHDYGDDLATLSWSEFVSKWPAYAPYGPGDTVAYSVSLTNPYDSPLNLSVKATITYMNQHWIVYNRDWSTLTFQFLNGAPLPGESSQVWENVTLQPGQTLTLDDTYFMPPETLHVTDWLHPRYRPPFLTGYNYAYGSTLNAYTYDVTITNLSTGLKYNDPVAGFFGYNGNWSLGGWATYR